MKFKLHNAIIALWVTAVSGAAFAQVQVQDDFTGSSATLDWYALGHACLTAGNNTGSIPACSPTLDTVGSGALRFTDAANNEAGAIVSKNPFSSKEGLSVIFTTYAYGGNSGGTGKDGADGMSFYLLDASKGPSLGAFGGSLGYSCSNTNTPYNGTVGGYLGLGMDEYGNFLNQSDNTSSGYGYVPGRIGLRGAGSTSWSWLTANYPAYYPSTLTSSQRYSAVQKTCETGYVYDFSNPSSPSKTGTALTYNYQAIPNAYSVLPSSHPIANESAKKRSDAVPITYKLKITPDGLLSLAYSYNGGAYSPVITDQSITASNGPLPDSFLFGFAGSTGGSTNVHEITCFKAQPTTLSSSSASVNQQSNKVETTTQVFVASYNPEYWTGDLTAQYLVYDPATGMLSGSSTINWDASCVLTGGACATTGQNTTVESPSSRTMLTWDGSKGVPFEWSSLTTAQQDALDQGDSTPINADRLQFLRGDRSNEINTSGVGKYRARHSVLGDITDSSPVWVGPPASSYPAAWTDLLNPTTAQPENSGTNYLTFESNTQNSQRTNIVYVGANDGFLHGFRAGADVNGSYDTTTNDGEEVLAYMPSAIVDSIHNATTAQLDYSNIQYAHAYSVDAMPTTGDLFYNGTWHTWLVGGTGAGGQDIFALDITDPSKFSEANAAGVVVGDWTSATISCTNDAGCGASLGYTYGTPVIRRFHNGEWGVIFGNGYNSSTGHAGIFIMLVDPSTGKQTFRFLDTGYGPANDPTGKNTNDGIFYASPMDFDGDNIVDYVYAGDLFGNVWRFDLTSSDPNSWKASSSPLFSTPSSPTNGMQPISTAVAVYAAPALMGPRRIMIDFGTGLKIPQTYLAATQYANVQQALYGIWDWNMAAWNAKSDTQFATLSAPQSVAFSDLEQQIPTTVSVAGPNGNVIFRTETANPVCWQGSTDCASGNNQFGWYMNLPASSSNSSIFEQSIYNPTIYFGAFALNTTIPPHDDPATCTSGVPTGFTMIINGATGGAFSESVFSTSPKSFPLIDGQAVTGLETGFVGALNFLDTSSSSGSLRSHTDASGSNGQGQFNGYPVNLYISPKSGSRLTWVEKR